jgi:SAM-dependent methyltransferase
MPLPDPDLHPEADGGDTAGSAYTERLVELQSVWWKRILPVQAPYRYNMRRLRLGRTLDVGCGLGRNLQHLPGGSVGIDHNAAFIAHCRNLGLTAYIPEDFDSSPDAVMGAFDAMILVHVVEHLAEEITDEILSRYLPYIRSGGHVHFITPQEVGFRSDPTHVRFIGFDELQALALRHHLDVVRSYSFPFPRRFGRIFVYNEFNVLARKP